MVAIPTAKDENAKRPNRERESLAGEQNRIINRMKAALNRYPRLQSQAEKGRRAPQRFAHA